MSTVELTAADAQDLLSKGPWTTSAEDERLQAILKAIAVANLQIALTGDKTAVEVVAAPVNTAKVVFAYMPSGWPSTSPAEHYDNKPYVAGMTYAPPAGYPIVGAAALDANFAVIGSYWTPRLTVIQVAPTPTPGATKLWLGLNDGGWPMVTDSNVTACGNIVRCENPSTGTIEAYEKQGKKIIYVLNPPESGGVASLNAEALCNQMLALVKAHPGIIAIEIINEPQNPYFWGSGAESLANIEAYARLLNYFVKRFVEAIGEAGMPRLLWSCDGGFRGVASWGRPVYEHLTVQSRTVLHPTVHPYGGHNSVQVSAEGNRARVREAWELTNKKVWVTEVGWPTALGKPNTGDSLQWTEAQQAENITNFVKFASEYGHVEAITFFQYRDYGENNWYGVESHEGRLKPAVGAMKTLQAQFGV